MKKFLDTNILLQNLDYVKKLDKFYLSSITLKELEYIKTNKNKDEVIKFKARQATKYLFNNENKYKIIIVKNKHYQLLNELELDYNNDNLIMACATLLDKDVEFYTLDLCCYNIGRIFGLNTIKVEKNKNEDNYKGYKEIIMNEKELAQWYEYNSNNWDLINNEYLLIKNENNQIIDRYKFLNGEFLPINVDKYIYSSYLGNFRPRDNYQLLALETLQNNQMSMIKGKAGTGKSLIAMSFLFQQLQKQLIDKIIIFTNPTPIKGAVTLGYYKGDKNEKLLSSQIGNFLFSKLGDKSVVEVLIANNKLEILPMSDIRGYDTSGMNCAVYITECQNTSVDLLKLVLQRIGEDSICILDGDYKQQVDNIQFESSNNGMKRVSEVFKGQDFYGEIELNKIYRSKIANIAEKM